MMYVFRCASRNAMNDKRDFQEFRTNYKSMMGMRAPHMDTVNAIMKSIASDELSKLQSHIVKILLSRRVLHKFRLLGKYFQVAIDGTGVFKFDTLPYNGCPFKNYKSGKTTYSQSVVEAKLICSNGFCISLCSEWITNEDGADKQDCEYNATKRLLKQLHKLFPRLPICIIMDGLFLKRPIQTLIKRYDWEFIMVWKDKTRYDLQEVVQEQRKEGKLETEGFIDFPNSCTRLEYELEFSCHALQPEHIPVYHIRGDKTEISTKPHIDKKKTKFIFMTSIPVHKAEAKAIFNAGRMRWMIENEGFNTQKNSGLALHHKMNRKNKNAIKNYYTCLQIAHCISQLMVLAKQSVARGYGTLKDLWSDFLNLIKSLPDYSPVTLKPKYNLRY